MKKLLGILCLLLAILTHLELKGAVHVVTSTLDSGTGSLRQSIADAGSGDTVLIDVKGDIALASAIDLSGYGELTIIGAFPKHTTISPTATCTEELFLIDDAGPIRFEAIGFEGGNGEVRHITVTNSALPKGVAFSRCRFQNNLMTASGKYGASVFANSSYIQLHSCSIIDNTTERGVIYGGGNAEIAIINTTISGNTASDKAAALYTTGSTTVSLFYSTIVYNEGDSEPEAICAAGSSEIRLENAAIGLNGSGQQMDEDGSGEIIASGGNVIKQNYLFEPTGIDVFLVSDLLNPFISFGLRGEIKEDGFGLKYWPIVSASSALINTQEPTVNTPTRDGRLAPRSLAGSGSDPEPDAGAIEYTHLRVTNVDGDESTPNSFLWAIDSDQQKDELHYIEFDIPGTPSPIFSESIGTVSGAKYIIDGFSQHGSAIPGPHLEGTPGVTRANILIDLVGDGAINEGIRFNSGSAGSTVQGLSIRGFDDHGIEANTDHIFIYGNEIGIDDAGGVVRNGRTGIRIDDDNATIGGRWHWQRNVVSGNGTDPAGAGNIGLIDGGSSRVVGNIIGGSPDGQSGIGAGTVSPYGIYINTRNNNIGAKILNTENIITDNEYGIYLDLRGDTTTIVNNHIGIAYDGSTAVGNTEAGIFIDGGDINTIGHYDTEYGNIIAHNGVGIALIYNTTIADQNLIIGNRIFANIGQGIDFDNDDAVFPNDSLINLSHQNRGIDHPVLNSLANCEGGNTKVSVTLSVPVGEPYRLEFFSNESPDPDNGEGQFFISAHTITPATNPETFTIDLGEVVDPTHTVSATVSQISIGITSEFGTNADQGPVDQPEITYDDQCPTIASVLPSTVDGLGGTFDFLTGPLGGETINPSTGEIYDLVEGSTYGVVYTIESVCELADTAYFSVINVPQEFTMDDICATIPNGTPVPVGPMGTFSFGLPDPGPDVTINNVSGEITGAIEGESYPVVHTLTIDGCTEMDTLLVSTHIVNESFSYDAPICGGETELPDFVATGGGEFTFDVDPGDGATIVGPTGELNSIYEGADNYQIKYVVSDINGCKDSSVVSIENISLNATLVYGDICPDITSAGPEDFSPGGDFSFYPIPENPDVTIDPEEGFIYNPEEDSIYNVVYKIVDSGCVDHDTIEVAVLHVVEEFSFEDFCWDSESPAPEVFGDDGVSSFSFLTDPGDDATINELTGVITDPTEMTTYSIVHVFTTDAGCSQSDTLNVLAAGIDESFTFEDFCPDSESPAPIPAETGGSFYLVGDVYGGTTIDVGTGVISNPYEDSTYIVQYAITFEPGCSQESTQEVTVIGVDESFSFPDFCAEFGSGIPVPSTPGGTFSLAPDPGGAIAIDSETGELSGIEHGTSYFIEYTVGVCAERDTVEVLAKATDTASFVLDDHCVNTPVAAEITGVEGGIFDFFPIPTDDAEIDATTGIISNSNGGSYTIRYINEGTATTCSDTATIDVTLFETPEILELISDQFLFCPTDEYTVTEVEHDGAFKVFWRVGDPDAIISDSTFNFMPDTLYPGENYFYAFPRSSEGCIGTQKELILTLSDTAGMRAESDFDICLGSPAELGAIGGSSYYWITDVNLSDEYDQYPTAFSLQEEVYKVEIKNDDGCLVTDSLSVGFLDRSLCQIDIFNAFSPNGDGVNDFWYIENLINFVPNEVYVYTRWGDEVARYENYDNINVYWDGNDANGRELPNGTYYYVVITDDPELNQAAWVQITR